MSKTKTKTNVEPATLLDFFLSFDKTTAATLALFAHFCYVIVTDRSVTYIAVYDSALFGATGVEVL